MQGWKPDALQEAMEQGSWTFESLASELRARGWACTHWTVRKWIKEASPGPPHPLQAVAIAQILEIEYTDLVRD